MNACPFGVPHFDYDKGLVEGAFIEKCTFCPQRIYNGDKPVCVGTCLTDVLEYGERDELLAKAHERIAAHPDRYINHVYGEFENGGTSYLILSHVPFKDLGLPELPEEPINEVSEKVMEMTIPFALTACGVDSTLTGQPEYCISCHVDLPEISASHPVETFGCVSCHGGERLALDADLAHSTMRGGANPSNLSVVEISCGGSSCHSGSGADDRHHIQRVTTSIQSTYAGAIANIHYTFGAQADLNAYLGITAVTDDETETGIKSLSAFDPIREENPFVQQFGENCLTCHINAVPREGESYARQTGCAACHSTGEHTFSTAIPYAQCNTCHNRGNYDLRTMTFVERTDHPANRLQDYYQPIAQFTQCEYTLDCVDCHTRDEAMGNGDLHSNKKDIQYAQCKTCHGTLTELPLTKTLTDLDDIAFKLDFLNPILDLKLGDAIIVTEKGEPLWNTRLLPDETFEMIGKATREHFSFRPVMGTACEQNPDEQESRYCHECHAVEK